MAVGLWAAQRGGRALWLVPLTFVLTMAAGGVLGFLGLSLPYVELGIASSVLILGILVALASRLSLAASMALVGLFAIFHGYAHGAEMAVEAQRIVVQPGIHAGHGDPARQWHRRRAGSQAGFARATIAGRRRGYCS